MRFALIAATIAVSSLAVLSSAYAEPTYVAGGPIKQGNLCQVADPHSDGMFGHLEACAPSSKKKS